MEFSIIDEIENECEVDLDWYYHSIHYKNKDYRDILMERIKFNYLLNRSWSGRHNGPYYISLSKITIPDNITFLNYACATNPSFILEGINPIKCERILEYEKYIKTKDKRRMGNFDGEYQHYYLIEKGYIKGILFNLYRYILNSKENRYRKIINVKNLLEIISLLEELNLDLPIYDYSRRERTLAHTIDKERLKYYAKDII